MLDMIGTTIKYCIMICGTTFAVIALCVVFWGLFNPAEPKQKLAGKSTENTKHVCAVCGIKHSPYGDCFLTAADQEQVNSNRYCCCDETTHFDEKETNNAVATLQSIIAIHKQAIKRADQRISFVEEQTHLAENVIKREKSVGKCIVSLPTTSEFTESRLHDTTYYGRLFKYQCPLCKEINEIKQCTSSSEDMVVDDKWVTETISFEGSYSPISVCSHFDNCNSKGCSFAESGTKYSKQERIKCLVKESNSQIANIKSWREHHGKAIDDIKYQIRVLKRNLKYFQCENCHDMVAKVYPVKVYKTQKNYTTLKACSACRELLKS